MLLLHHLLEGSQNNVFKRLLILRFWDYRRLYRKAFENDAETLQLLIYRYLTAARDFSLMSF